MARRPGQPTYLGQARYRQRRLRDAARLLPVAGCVLWMIPLLWPRGAEGGTLNSAAVVYMFGVWALLIGIAALMAPHLGPEDEPPAARDEDG